MSKTTVKESLIIIEEPSWKAMMHLQRTLRDYPTMSAIVFVKPPFNNIMALNKLRNGRIVAWLDHGKEFRESIIEAHENMMHSDPWLQKPYTVVAYADTGATPPKTVEDLEEYKQYLLGKLGIPAIMLDVSGDPWFTRGINGGVSIADIQAVRRPTYGIDIEKAKRLSLNTKQAYLDQYPQTATVLVEDDGFTEEDLKDDLKVEKLKAVRTSIETKTNEVFPELFNEPPHPSKIQKLAGDYEGFVYDPNDESTWPADRFIVGNAMKSVTVNGASTKETVEPVMTEYSKNLRLGDDIDE